MSEELYYNKKYLKYKAKYFALRDSDHYNRKHRKHSGHMNSMRPPIYPMIPIIPMRMPINPMRMPINPMRTYINPMRTYMNPMRTPIQSRIPINPIYPIRTPIQSRIPINPMRTFINPRITTSSTNGIVINNKLISSISGPVSMYYLKPKIVKNEGIDFPLIILFGDKHFSDENMCNNCTCVYNNCCYRIDDERFLQNLDKLSSKSNPVDFYIEDFFEYNVNAFKGGIMENMISGKMAECYNKVLQNEMLYDECPTRNIRWHYGDVRSATGSVEYIINSTGLINIYNDSILINDVLSSGYLPTIKNLLNVLLLSKPQINGQHDFNFKDFATGLFNLFDEQKEKSLIYKQFIKQSYQPFRNWNYWTDMYYQSLMNCINLFDDLPIFTMDDINSIGTKNNSHMARLFFNISLSFVDIYIIMRMMKKPSGIDSVQPSMCFGYFGDLHTINTTKLLVHSDLYDIVYVKNQSKTDNRCIKIDQNINIDEDIRKHNIARM
jgi:hypothetical protein